MHFESLLVKEKKQERSLSRDYEFQPKLSDASRDLALKLREKMEHTAGQAKLTPLDWLRQPAKDPKWEEAAKQLVE